jgi:N6-L-threonylcarbamoyladenine synthase
LAKTGKARRFPLPRPLLGREGADFSFSGLKTAIRQIVRAQSPLAPEDKADLAAGFQAAVVDVMSDRVGAAMQMFRTMFGNTNELLRLVAAGGVAANGPIRAALQQLCRQEDFVLSLPPAELCTDNGAMVGWAGLERLASGLTDSLGAPPRARWPLEEFVT